MLKRAKDNIREDMTKITIRKTSTFNKPVKSIFRRNLTKTREKLRSLQKNSLNLLNNEEIKNDINAVNLIYLLNQLNGAVPKCYFDVKDPDNDALYVTKKIFYILKNYNIFFFFFSHYQIEDKIILKLIPLMGYVSYQKNQYILHLIKSVEI